MIATSEVDTSGGKKRKREPKLSNREKKKLVIRMEKTLTVTTQKVHERMIREKMDKSDSSQVAVMFGRVAYDLARSGTSDQVREIESVAPSILIPLRTVSSNSAPLLMRQCVAYAESAFLLSLSGVRVASSELAEISFPNADIYTVLFDNAIIIIRKVCAMDGVNLTESPSESSKPSLALVADLLTALELFAASGICDSASESNGIQRFAVVADILEEHERKQRSQKGTAMSTQAISFVPNEFTEYFSPSGALGWQGVHHFLDDVRECHKNDWANSMLYWLHATSGRPLTALWKHSIKQKKVRSKDSQLVPGTRLAKLSVDNGGAFIWSGDSPVGFADMNRPLVIDVGCGFGTSLLGLAVSNAIGNTANFLGCDLSDHCVEYARGIASRWDISARCRFCVVPAEDFLVWVRDHYPGPVLWILVQFPTPFKLEIPTGNASKETAVTNRKKKKKVKGLVEGVRGKNVQLPSIDMEAEESHTDEATKKDDTSGFMVSRLVAQLVTEIASSSISKGNCGADGKGNRSSCCSIYTQSNVEDVAVLMKKRFESQLASCEDIKYEHLKATDNESNHGEGNSSTGGAVASVSTKRQLAWEAAGGERALPVVTEDGEGSRVGWMLESPWGLVARTETEAAYAISRKPVYRIGWKIKQSVEKE